MIELKVNTQGLEDKILKLSLHTGKTVAELMRQEGRLLAVQAARYTQPFGFDKKARDQGEGAVRRDYGKVYPPIDSNFMLNRIRMIAREDDQQKAQQRFKRYFDAGDTKALTRMLTGMKIGGVDAKADPAFHDRRWNNGRLKSGPSQFVTQTRTVVRLVKAGLSRVGLAKWGWASCADQLGGTRGIPQWVTRHRKTVGQIGQVIDRTNEETPVLILRNKVNYTDRVFSSSNQRAAVRDCEIRLQARIKAAIAHPPRELAHA